MTWRLYRWVWRLESPLFIGMPPAGALNRCRMYVPGRAMWGAVTAEVARSAGDDFPNYEEIGRTVREKCRFSYLYPAEADGDDYQPWIPRYDKNDGLTWRLQNSGRFERERDFRRLLIGARPSTAIAPEMDSAADGTLRETECILPWWRYDSEIILDPKPVYLIGYVLIEDSQMKDSLESITTLFLGGDTRYGLGKVRRIAGINEDTAVFGLTPDLGKDSPTIKSDHVLGHTILEDVSGMYGMRELMGGWHNGKPIRKQLTWVPGSRSESEKHWEITPDGYWCLSK
jgi:hypothetical protein